MKEPKLLDSRTEEQKRYLHEIAMLAVGILVGCIALEIYQKHVVNAGYYSKSK